MNCAQYAIQLLHAIAWHHLAFVLTVVFIVMFKKEISTLIKRIRQIGKGGLLADPSPGMQQNKKTTEEGLGSGVDSTDINNNQEGSTSSSSGEVQKLLAVWDNFAVINERSINIKNDLDSRGISNDEEKIKILIRHLAGTQISLAFETVHSNIFGSQIFLLKRLNVVRGQGLNEALINEHIDQVKARWPEQFGQWTEELYLKFLFDCSLISQNEDMYHITDLGTEYLTWMTKNGRPDNKPL